MSEVRSETCRIFVNLRKSDSEIKQGAAELGRLWGRGRDWEPSGLNEALAEILIMSDMHEDYGVEVVQPAPNPRSLSQATRADIYAGLLAYSKEHARLNRPGPSRIDGRCLLVATRALMASIQEPEENSEVVE